MENSNYMSPPQKAGLDLILKKLQTSEKLIIPLKNPTAMHPNTIQQTLQ